MERRGLGVFLECGFVVQQYVTGQEPLIDLTPLGGWSLKVRVARNMVGIDQFLASHGTPATAHGAGVILPVPRMYRWRIHSTPHSQQLHQPIVKPAALLRQILQKSFAAGIFFGLVQRLA